MRYLTGLLIGVFNFLALQAQRNCGTVDYVKAHPFVATQNAFERGGRDTIVNEIITIPVVIHVLYNNPVQNISDAQILSQIDVLNKDYRALNEDIAGTPQVFKNLIADSRISFCLAKVAPGGYSTNGIVRKYTTVSSFLPNDDMKFSDRGGADAWDSKKYLNIWVCSMQGRILGYATVPGGPANADGVVINYDVFGNRGTVRNPFNKGRTTTHEVGHWLGLKHLWGDTDCGDDGIADTPQQYGYNYGCPNFPRKSLCSLDANGDLFMNFMDFANDACMFMFTHGQKIKMRTVFSKTGFRNAMLQSFTCDSANASAGPLPQETPRTTAIEPIQETIRLKLNPVSDFIEFIYKEKSQLAGKQVQIITTTGVRLYHTTLLTGTEKISVQYLPSGIYLLVVGNGAHRNIFKLVKI